MQGDDSSDDSLDASSAMVIEGSDVEGAQSDTQWPSSVASSGIGSVSASIPHGMFGSVPSSIPRAGTSITSVNPSNFVDNGQLATVPSYESSNPASFVSPSGYYPPNPQSFEPSSVSSSYTSASSIARRNSLFRNSIGGSQQGMQHVPNVTSSVHGYPTLHSAASYGNFQTLQNIHGSNTPSFPVVAGSPFNKRDDPTSIGTPLQKRSLLSSMIAQSRPGGVGSASQAPSRRPSDVGPYSRPPSRPPSRADSRRRSTEPDWSVPQSLSLRPGSVASSIIEDGRQFMPIMSRAVATTDVSTTSVSTATYATPTNAAAIPGEQPSDGKSMGSGFDTSILPGLKRPRRELRFDFHDCNIQDVLDMVTVALSVMIEENDSRYPPESGGRPLDTPPLTSQDGAELKDQLMGFHGCNVPGITLDAYLNRILKYCPTTAEVFLSILVYFDRIRSRAARYGQTPVDLFVLDSYNIHRLVIAGVTVASKFFSDIFYKNSRYAKVGGLPAEELNHLELQFLLLTDFNLMVSVEELHLYADFLLNFRAEQGRKRSP